ncbi:MAG: hypothetical protein FGM18_05060 [Burkholderiaceae bacterium]|nr:hypothetical protein [Burkholderiaceae bacterium]
MSDSAAVSRVIFKSRLISAVLLLVSIACFVVMSFLPEPVAVPTPAPEPKAGARAPAAATNLPITPGTPQEAAEQIRARLSAADHFDTDFYTSLDSIQSRLAGLSVPEAALVQKQITALKELQKRLVSVRELSQTVNRELELLLAKGGVLYKGVIPPGSPFVGISDVLEKLRVDFLNVQAKKPIESLKSFQVSLKALMEAREKLNDPKLAPEMNERRKAIVARIDALTVMRRAKDWESVTFAAVAISAELNRLAGAMASGGDQAPVETGVGFALDTGVVSRLFGAIGFIALLLSVFEVLRCDRRLLTTIDLTEVDSALTNANRFEALQKANESLPYVQLAAKQISDLGRQLIAAIKKLGATVQSLETPKEITAEDPALKVLLGSQFRAREIQRDFALLKEQSIKLSLVISQTNAEIQVVDAGDKLAENIEHVDSIARTLQQELDAAVTKHMSADPGSALQHDAVVLKRDAEALLLIASQWTRQFDRLNEALGDIDRLLNVASSTTPAASARKNVTDVEDLLDVAGKREPA